MALAPGIRLGPYEVVAQIGVGGMGEVYRATDTKLKRDVAIKVLPDALAADADRLARFQREAEVLASLNHPGIAHIYGIEDADDSKALVLELVEGPTLADRIAQGPLPVDEALTIARQIAEALEAAHEQGIIHRDLKPANIKLRPDGMVKVLDFGLAKVMEPVAAQTAGQSLSPTITTPAVTQAGVILGTAAYMSPEQARGRPADRRTDVWSFGAVFYEMLTGRPVFAAGETVSDTLALILRGDPDLKGLPAETPPKMTALIERCLRKDIRRRLPDIGEARIEIEDVQAEPASQSPMPPVSRRNLWPVIALASLLLAAAVTGWNALKQVPEADVVQLEILAPLSQGAIFGQPLAPDGHTVAFVAGPVGKQQIWVRPLNSKQAQPLTGTEGSARFAWSPDSRNLAFFADGRLKKISSDGGAVQEIAQVSGRDLAWGPGDVILIGGRSDGLLRVPAGGGSAERVTELVENETTHDYPDFLPDGRHFLYMARHGSAPADWDVYIGSFDSKERQLVPDIHSGTRYSGSGYLVFNRDGGSTLTAQPFDARQLRTTGGPFAVAEGVYGGVSSAIFATSDNGSLAYYGQEVGGDTVPTWVDRSGRPLQAAAAAGDYRNIELSPNEKYVAFDRGTSRDVFVLDLSRGLTSKFTTNDAADAVPVWSPGSDTIAFLSSRNTPVNVAQQNIAGGNLYAAAFGVVGAERQLSTSTSGQVPTDWTRHGPYLIYESEGDIWALPMSGDNSETLRITETPFEESHARVSPNGRWLAYDSLKNSTRTDVFIRSFPKPGIEVQVSSDGGSRPRWSPDGSEVFYLSALPDSHVMAVSVKESGAELQPGAPVSLFPAKLPSLEEFRSYDVASGGRFLMNLATTERSVLPITVIHNWAAGLRQ